MLYILYIYYILYILYIIYIILYIYIMYVYIYILYYIYYIIYILCMYIYISISHQSPINLPSISGRSTSPAKCPPFAPSNGCLLQLLPPRQEPRGFLLHRLLVAVLRLAEPVLYEKREVKRYGILYPIGSMYGIYANIWGILMVNVTIYSIHTDPSWVWDTVINPYKISYH